MLWVPLLCLFLNNVNNVCFAHFLRKLIIIFFLCLICAMGSPVYLLTNYTIFQHGSCDILIMEDGCTFFKKNITIKDGYALVALSCFFIMIVTLVTT